MTALQIIQAVSSRIGLASPTVVFSSTDAQVIQMRHLLNQEGKELGKRHPWTKLVTEKTFTTVAAAIQTSAVPSDFGWYLNGTMWNRTTDRQIFGPMSAADLQRQQAIAATSTIHTGFRFRGGELLWYPSPTASQTAAYEYVSKNWGETSGGTDLSTMTADTDVGLLDEDLITLGVIWRFRKAKGLDYAEEFRTYQMEVGKAIARDGGRADYSLHGHAAPPYNANIDEGSWPL